MVRIEVTTLKRHHISASNLRPKRARSLSVAAKSTVVMIMNSFRSTRSFFVIATCFYRGGREDVIEIVSIWLLFDPLSDSSKHVSVNFEVLVAESGMVEDVKNVLHDFINWDAGVLPGIENTSVKVRIRFSEIS